MWLFLIHWVSYFGVLVSARPLEGDDTAARARGQIGPFPPGCSVDSVSPLGMAINPHAKPHNCLHKPTYEAPRASALC